MTDLAATRRVAIVISFALAATALFASGTSVSAADQAHSTIAPEEVPAPLITDGPNEAEMEDLETLASQIGISIEGAIDRYAWNDNFAQTVTRIRERMPESFAGAEIVDANSAWIAFAVSAPIEARIVVDEFRKSSGVLIEMRTDLGFTELQLLEAIEKVHYGLLNRREVSNATTSFDYAASRITSIVVVDPAASDDLLDDLRVVAVSNLSGSGFPAPPEAVDVAVVRSNTPTLGGTESSSSHLGGEAINGSQICTSGFIARSQLGTVRYVATAGHCPNSLTDDGVSLNFSAYHQGGYGDFQVHTGSQSKPDDFYSGNSSTLEVNKRDVSSVGSPVVNQALCRNGRTTKKKCQDVRKVNVCHSIYCNLVQMDAHLSDDGDSGAPVFWGNKAYGLHHGWHYDLFPFDRELFSRADRIDDAFGSTVFIATS